MWLEGFAAKSLIVSEWYFYFYSCWGSWEILAKTALSVYVSGTVKFSQKYFAQHTLMNFKGNAISAAVTKQFKPAHFPSHIKAFAFWDSAVRMMLSLWLSPNSSPGQTHSLARQPGRDKYKETVLSSHEKVGAYLISFQKFLHYHLCKTGSE